MRQAMTDLAFSPEEQLSVSKILGAVMNLSLLDFIPGQTEDSSQVKNKDRCELVARILDLHEAPISVEQSLCQEEMVVKRGSRSSVSWKQSTPKKAALARDAFAKALYGLLFDWLVVKVNKSLFKGETAVHFGVLDIFGFETFQVNSFEQLCINYTNEKLQSHFNKVIFSQEMEMYKSEEVPYKDMEVPDNGPCVALIEASKPPGLLSLLDEQCNLGKATDETYLNAIDKAFSKKGKTPNEYFFKKPQWNDQFAVKHFAGTVDYNITNFLEKNRDKISPTLASCAKTSESDFVAGLFAEPPSRERRLWHSETSRWEGSQLQCPQSQ